MPAPSMSYGKHSSSILASFATRRTAASFGRVRALCVARPAAPTMSLTTRNPCHVHSKPHKRTGMSIVRTMSGSTPQSSDSSTVGPDFPELPPAPSFPCPFLTDEEIMTYLPPLYARGWTVQPSDPKAAKKPAPELVKRFVFSAHETLEAFLHLDLLDITESENHHAWRDITPDPPSIVVRVHTHSGLRPERDAEEPRRARVQPGITLRDVRFAYLLEQRLAARGGTAERAGAENVLLSPEEHPLSAAEVEARRGLPGNE